MKTQTPISVYLVDDDTVYLTTLVHYLNRQLQSRIQIESFSNGEDCLKEIEKNPAVDLVVLDYNLNVDFPDSLNGLEVLKKIKEINSDIIVLILSGEDKLQIARNCIEHGAYEYVVKTETALVRTANIIKNLIYNVKLQSYYLADAEARHSNINK